MKAYDTDPLGLTDACTPRSQPCPLRTWCVLVDGHTDSCVEVPRRPIPPGDYGPKAATRRRW